MAREDHSGHILVVEDDSDVRELLDIQLTRLGYQVTQAASAGECIASLRSGGRALDLVVLDRHLPDSDGSDILRLIRDDPEIPKVPVVVISGNHQVESIVGMLACGAVDYLVKPFDGRVLEARVAAALRESRQKQTLLKTQQTLARIKRELQLIFDAVSEAVMLVNPDMTIRRINRAGLAMAGKRAYAELVGQKCHRAIHGLDQPCPDCPVAAAFREGRDQERDMVRHVAGRSICRRQRAFLLKPPGGGPPLVVEVTEDVSEQRQVREELVRAEKLQAVMRLAGALAHEIGQPLSAVSGRAELLEMALGQPGKPAEPGELARHLESLRANARRIAEIVRRLQNISSYVTKPYYGGVEILDLERSSGAGAVAEEPPPPPPAPPPEQGKPRP